MFKLILRILNPVVFFFMVVAGVAVQTSLFALYPLNYLQPDIILLAVIWCALRRNFIEGGILTLVFANVAEIHTSAPQGLFLCCYMAVYLGLRAASRFFIIPSISSLIIATLCSSILWKFSYVTVLHLLGAGAQQWRHMLMFLFPGAVMEGILGVWVFKAMERFDWITFKNEKARQMLEDELQLDGEGL
ncbi:MAG: hypothetical protein A2583_01805 [Bdellovibrionales bacterium RIFOXYD1_FULL_53_11]|nr:MAG: hypothetical protein A2583_01805 [Bdellovibrionales bacterium RIFOXYD1_FULL_53_11]